MDAKRLLSILIATLLLVGSANLVTARGDDADDPDVRDAEDDASDHEDEADEETDDASDDADDSEDDAEDAADEAEDEAEDAADDAEDDSDEAEDEEDSDEAELEDCDEVVANGTLVCTDEEEDDELEQEDCDEVVVNGTLACVEDDDERSGHDEADDEDNSGNGCVKTEVKYENEYVDENGTRVKEKYEAKGRDCEDDSKDRFEERASTKTKNATHEAEDEVEIDSRPGIDGPTTTAAERSDKADEARSEVKVKIEEKRSDNLGQQVRKVVFEAKLQASKPIDALRQLFASWFG